MSYIGVPPAQSFTALLKQDFTTSATTSYTLDHSVNNANDIALFINFVRQEPTAAYSASGTSLTLTSATSVSDDMYCVYLGQALQTVNPPNGSVGTAQLFSGFANGITMADQWRLTANITGTNADITSNLERVDSTGWGGIGTGVTESSGIFSFPSTGVYLINVNASFFNPTGASGIDGLCNVDVYVTTDNSSYTKVARAYGGFEGTTNDRTSAGTTSFILDVTDISNVKIKFATSTLNADTSLQGSTDENRTDFLFIRLGDT